MSIATQRVTGLRLFCSISALVALGMWPGLGFAQTTAFTYSGKLTDSGNPANGNFDLQFALFDNAQGGAQIGANQTVPGTAVNAGVFTVQLDFGVNAFPGANRFLEIGVRPANVGNFTVLGPRQQISSTPYAIRTLNAGSADALSPGCVGCVQDSNIAAVSGGKLTGEIAATGIVPPAVAPAGQGRIYFDSASNKLKASENGSAYVNLIGGASGVNGSGTTNKVPLWSGTTTLGNSAITQAANNIGIGNASPFYQLDVTGVIRATGVAANDVIAETSAGTNSWARHVMKSPFQEWALGTSQNYNGNQIYLSDDTYSQARMTIQPGGGAISFPIGNVGIGTNSPATKLHVSGTGFVESTVESTNERAILSLNSTLGGQNRVWTLENGYNASPGLLAIYDRTGGRVALTIDPVGPYVGIGKLPPPEGVYSLDVASALRTGTFLKVGTTITFGNVGTGDTSNQLCLNSGQTISFCASSLRYKKNVTPFNSGLDVINRLQPITFDWRTTGVRDVGLGAEDVAKVEPLLVVHNRQGDIEGVKYGQLATLFINAFKEQQKEIESLRARVRQVENSVRKE